MYADSRPAFSRVYGDYFVSGLYQNPNFSQNDYDVYLAHMSQFSTSSQQGDIDYSFGNAQINAGAVIPCNGFCGHFLQQKVKDIREVATNKFLVGIDGKLDTSNSSNMMLSCLSEDGIVDPTFGNAGFIALSKYQSDEYLCSALQDSFSDLYVAGYGSTGSIVRKYNYFGEQLWIADNNITGSSVYDIALQGTTRLLVAHQFSDQQGHLVAYDLATGAIDQTFYASGIVPGMIMSPDFGLQIGLLYGVVVSSQENIFMVYKNKSTGHIDLAALYADGRSLISQFASKSINPGVVYNVFSSNNVVFDKVCLALDNYNNIVIAASIGRDVRIVRLDGQTGTYDHHFNCAGRLTIPSVGDAVVIKKIVGLTDGSITLVGYDQADAMMLVMKVTIAGQLDTNFNAQGHTPGIARFAIGDTTTDYYARCLTSLSIQSSTGDLIIGGYQQRTAQDALPIVMKLHGVSGVTEIKNDLFTDMIPGFFDSTIADIDVGQKDLSQVAGWEELSGYTAYCIQANSDGTMYIAFGNGESLVIGLIDSNMYPVVSFGANGLSSLESMTKIYSLIVDSAGRILVAGSYHGEQKIVRYMPSGSLDLVFASILSLTVSSSIAEQKSGQIIVGGYVDGTGVICGYQNNGKKCVSSFGCYHDQGYYTTQVNSPIDDVVVDGQDAIYLVYRNEQNHICLEKIMPNGSIKVTTFNNGETIDTGIVAIKRAHIALNSDGNILIGSSTALGVQVCLYDGATGVALSSIQTIDSGEKDCILTKIVGVGAAFVGSCFNKDGKAHVFKFSGSIGAIDTEFGSLQDGITVFELSLALHGVSVQLDGRIVLVGSHNNDPVLARLHCDSYINQYPQMPGKSDVGTLDTTLLYTPPIHRAAVGTLDGSFGAFNFNSLSAGDFNVAGFTLRHIHEYVTGVMLFVADNGTDTIIFRLLNDLSLDTIAHGGPGFNQAITAGYIKITGKANPMGLYVDEYGKVFIAGGSTTSWAYVYNDDGSLVSNWVNPTNNLSQGVYQVGIQSCGRFIVAGQGASFGVLYGYTPTGDLDVEFGVNGVVSTGIAAPIVDISIDALDRIIIVSVVSGSAVLQRVSAQGITITNIDSGTAVTDITGNDVRIAQDVIGNIIVAAATSSGFSLRRYDSNGADNPSTAVAIAAGGSSSSHIGNLYVTSDNEVGLVGYESTGNNIVCARLDAAFVLDPDFNSGVALVATDSPMNLVCDATVYVDNKIMIVGGSSIVPDPYMARVFGDAYVSVISQSPLHGIACTNDLTFGTDGADGITFYALTGGASQNQVAKAIALQGEQNFVIALDGQSMINDENRMFINMFNADGVLQASFGTGGKIEIPHMYQNEYVTDMMISRVADVHKAILVGYVMNSSLSITSSLIMQYDLTGAFIDTTFGGSHGSPQGFVANDGLQFHGVSCQSTGRIIATGLDYAGNGLLVGYTPNGKLDISFGVGGSSNQGTTGIYAHVIDVQDRIIIAYNDGFNRVAVARILDDGSGLDASFNSVGVTPGIVSVTDMVSGVIGNQNFKVAIDQDGNIVVVAVNNFNVDCVLRQYTVDGTLSAELIITGSMLGGITNLTLSKLLIDQQGKVVIIGFDHAVADQIVVARVLADFSGLDPLANSSGTHGYVKYAIAGGTTQLVTDALLHPDGRVILVGAKN